MSKKDTNEAVWNRTPVTYTPKDIQREQMWWWKHECLPPKTRFTNLYISIETSKTIFQYKKVLKRKTFSIYQRNINGNNNFTKRTYQKRKDRVSCKALINGTEARVHCKLFVCSKQNTWSKSNCVSYLMKNEDLFYSKANQNRIVRIHGYNNKSKVPFCKILIELSNIWNWG